MSRPILALLAFFVLAGFTDPGGKFSIKFPPGWSEPTSSDAGGTMQSNDPNADGKIWCRANSVTLASLKDLSQAQINETYSAPFDHGTWAGFLSVDAALFTESEVEVRIVDGRVVQVATLTFKPEVMGAVVKTRIKDHILPGHVVNAACFAPSGDFEGKRAVFETVLDSLRPL